MSTLDEIKHKIEAISIPAEVAASEAWTGKMIYEVFNDGELSMEKAGILLNRRNLHCLERGHCSYHITPNLFPNKTNGFGFVYCTKEHAQELHTMITEHLKRIL